MNERECLKELLKYKLPKTAISLINEVLNAEKPFELIDCVRKNNDVNGNPRFVCHFLSLITKEEQQKVYDDMDKGLYGDRYVSGISILYELALKKSRKIGGRKYHNKQFGGGIIFQVYSESELTELVKGVL